MDENKIIFSIGFQMLFLAFIPALKPILRNVNDCIKFEYVIWVYPLYI